MEQMKTEMQNPALAQYELLISYLKIFLITASRLKDGTRTTSTTSNCRPQRTLHFAKPERRY